MTRLGLSFIALLVTCLLSRVQGIIVQDDWAAPHGPDNSSTLIIGSQYTIQWTSHLWAWFQYYAPDADVTNVDLWITGFYQHQYGHLVSQRVNVNTTTSLVWRVQVPADELYASPYWVFRFLPSGLTFAQTSESISSPGFEILNLTTTTTTTSSTSTSTSISTTSRSTTTSSTSTVSTSATSTTSTASTTSTGVVTATVTSTPSPTGTSGSSASSGLSTGAKIGIIVAAVLIAICIAAGIWFCIGRRRRSKSEPSYAPQPTSTNEKEQHAHQSPGELVGSTKFPPKYQVRPGNRTELDHDGHVRYGGVPPYELPS